jgi:hypothetical protein
MSSTATLLKRHNHRVHPCKPEQKQELLTLLLTQNANKNILVVATNTTDILNEVENAKNTSIISDEDLANAPELKCELLISYDLPQKAIIYMARIARTTEFALILLDPEEQTLLYPIETLSGRTLMQETVAGFETVVKKTEPIKKEFKPRNDKKEFKPKRDDFRGEKKEYKPRSNEERGEKKYGDKPARDDKRPAKKPYNKDASKAWDNKEKKGSKFLGKDENGKALFSGKTGDRNHRHDGTPKDYVPKVPGRKINIKSLKKPEEKE